jgi:SAM-dependent methyltransferase
LRYGTRAWLESQYAASSDDPWGLDWRPSQRFRYANMLAAVQQVSTPWAPLRIVDAGCATGAFTAMLAETFPSAEITGIDIAEAAVTRASARYPGISFERMALDECASKFGASADLVACLEVLYYLPREERSPALKQLRTMLRPGGILLVSSMIAGHPYMSLDELIALVANELPIVHAGALYLKPAVLWEKARMRFQRLWRDSPIPESRDSALVDTDRVARLAAWSKRILGAHARSHGFVVARLA